MKILERPEYCGHVVNFRSGKDSYKDKHNKLLPKSEWKIFENRHEPIVDQATFDNVQKLRGTPRRIDSLGEANPLTGLLWCYDCNAKMYNHRYKATTTKINDHYDCSNYTLSSRRFAKQCSGRYIRTDVVRELVLESIRNICGYVRENQSEFVEKIRAESILHQGKTANLHKKTIAKNEKRIAELDNLFRKTYEDNANGKLSDARFEQMSTDYEQEQAELRTLNAQMQAELDEYNADGEKADRFIELVKKYTEFEELTTAMLNEFVDKIFIHKPVKNKWGERTQTVDIHFNFIGNFAVPIEEVKPTVEEIKALEKLRIKRAKQRVYNFNYRAKQKAKLSQEKADNPA